MTSIEVTIGFYIRKEVFKKAEHLYTGSKVEELWWMLGESLDVISDNVKQF